MFSYKGLFARSFFECGDCGFVFTTLSQADYQLEGCCPACGESSFDYATKKKREDFIKGLKLGLEMFEKELKR